MASTTDLTSTEKAHVDALAIHMEAGTAHTAPAPAYMNVTTICIEVVAAHIEDATFHTAPVKALIEDATSDLDDATANM